MKPSDPLTLEEVQKASDIFFPLFEEIKGRMPFNSSIEDSIKVMESVCSLAQKLRTQEDNDGPFGFNKRDEEGQDGT